MLLFSLVTPYSISLWFNVKFAYSTMYIATPKIYRNITSIFHPEVGVELNGLNLVQANHGGIWSGLQEYHFSLLTCTFCLRSSKARLTIVCACVRAYAHACVWLCKCVLSLQTITTWWGTYQITARSRAGSCGVPNHAVGYVSNHAGSCAATRTDFDHNSLWSNALSVLEKLYSVPEKHVTCHLI